jgi:hypothetical protein
VGTGELVTFITVVLPYTMEIITRPEDTGPEELHRTVAVCPTNHTKPREAGAVTMSLL